MGNLSPNPAVNADAHRRGFARAAVTGYLTRQASQSNVHCPPSHG